MKTHELQLAAEPFTAIKTSRKTIESRLYDTKRQQIELGDQLTFINREHPDQVIAARIIGLLRYDSFEALFSHNEPAKFGGPSVKWLMRQIREFYPLAKEQEHGVIGIEFVLL